MYERVTTCVSHNDLAVTWALGAFCAVSEEPSPSCHTDGILSPHSTLLKKRIQDRLGSRNQQPDSTTKSDPTGPQISAGLLHCSYIMLWWSYLYAYTVFNIYMHIHSSTCVYRSICQLFKWGALIYNIHYIPNVWILTLQKIVLKKIIRSESLNNNYDGLFWIDIQSAYKGN